MDGTNSPDLTPQLEGAIDSEIPDHLVDEERAFNRAALHKALSLVAPAISKYQLVDSSESTQWWGADDEPSGATRVDVHTTDIGRVVRARSYLGEDRCEALADGDDPEPDTTTVEVASRSALATAYYLWEGLGLPMTESDPFDQLPGDDSH